MAKSKDSTVIKKYANRRLYNTGTSTYVTLEDLAEMVKNAEDFVVFDAKSGEDITRSVLTQIIFEQENKGHNLLPIAFLRQLIGFYGDSMQNVVPSYLEFSLASFSRDQEKIREQLSKTFGVAAFDTMEEQVRRNTEMFENAMRMFLPFGADSAAKPTSEETEPAGETAAAPAGKDSDIDVLKQQIDAMRQKLDDLAKDKS